MFQPEFLEHGRLDLVLLPTGPGCNSEEALLLRFGNGGPDWLTGGRGRCFGFLFCLRLLIEKVLRILAWGFD